MATTPDLQEPQIAAARAKAWHHAPENTSESKDATEDTTANATEAKNPLLTMEAARAFINDYGLVLFAPRKLGAPAPSLVEATLGEAKATATPAECEVARGLVSRLVGEGSALPLNLLGGPGDVPDFIVSASAFPFVFTLRGDKGWKRPPETSGAVKVTPLALRVYELLTEKGAMTAAEMVPEVGREVTDSAITRALNELWAMLRVIPVLQQGEGETMWELTTTRFSKAVKAGANAGQPTALSALISLYLAQAFVASEEEIASFLSPLTARSRVRDVLHGLTAGRQLSEGVVEGKAVLYIPDALPDFAKFGETSDASLEEDGDAEDLEAGADEPTDATAEFDAEASPAPEGEGRIRRFDAGSAAPLRGKPLRGKPLGRDGAARPGFRSGPRPATPRTDGDRPRSTGYKGNSDRPDRPKRNFGSDAPRPRPEGDRPSFARPWDEERASRPAAGGGEGRPPRREGTEGRPYRPAGGEGRPPRREGGSDRPPFRREGGAPGGSRPPFRREGGAPGGSRPPFRREGSSERPAFSRGGDRPPFRRRDEGEGERPAGRSFSPGAARPGSDRGDRPSFGDRAPRGDRPSFGDRAARGDRPSFGDRPRSSRPPSDRPYTPRPYVKREGGDDRPPRPSFDRPRGDRPDRPSFDRPRGDRPDRPSFDRPRPGGFGGPRGEGGPTREGSRGPGGRPPFRAGSYEGRGAGRPGGDGAGRPSFRPRPGAGSDRPSRGPGYASGGAGGGFNRGPKRDAPGGFSPRSGPKGPPRDRPAPRRKPEDEA